jgi:hypothetical protein
MGPVKLALGVFRGRVSTELSKMLNGCPVRATNSGVTLHPPSSLP